MLPRSIGKSFKTPPPPPPAAAPKSCPRVEVAKHQHPQGAPDDRVQDDDSSKHRRRPVKVHGDALPAVVGGKEGSHEPVLSSGARRVVGNLINALETNSLYRTQNKPMSTSPTLTITHYHRTSIATSATATTANAIPPSSNTTMTNNHPLPPTLPQPPPSPTTR